ncbi:SMP-30/gluconolactonase/LRE family protein [Paucibacter sp. APW11]|uniref:SMP-30/gluconolactonase/LRE family protein n=1 Tax=Roseateles aquae TaxID=3077235 RepID=A0ABU3PBW4_9BURK|nr:SMP-30/gluconolactonase/LRE family protein [Paucibacter sp. APW11]MDT9000060.1 SMP-30/gluconolactonase/LRE family protein [Paucibacter sp. APW11]
MSSAAPPNPPLYQPQALGEYRAALGESPLWHPLEHCLYFVDIARGQVLRWREGEAAPQAWPVGREPGCIAALAEGGLLLAQRDGLFKFDTVDGSLQPLLPPPYDAAAQRFNDGKADAQGRFWVGTIDDARRPASALYRLAAGSFTPMLEGITTSNGLAWSPDGRRLYSADTKAHRIDVCDFDPVAGAVSDRRCFAQFEARQPGQDLNSYGGRPDGAAVDIEGCYWVAMYEGQRLLRLSPEGQVLRQVELPMRCPTMPAFGGADLRTLFVTSASDGRPADELAAQPLAGAVLRLRVEVPGLPSHLARL